MALRRSGGAGMPAAEWRGRSFCVSAILCGVGLIAFAAARVAPVAVFGCAGLLGAGLLFTSLQLCRHLAQLPPGDHCALRHPAPARPD